MTDPVYYAMIPQVENEARLAAEKAAQRQIAALTQDALKAQETLRLLNEENSTLKNEAARLKAALEAATKPPTVPTTRLFGFTIENSSKTPSATEYAKNKTAMAWGQQIGFNRYRIFLNPTEMRSMSLGVGALENIIAYGSSLGLAWMADTMDTICKMLPLDSSLKTYCDGGARLGWSGVYFNDADRADLPIETLKTMVSRVRKAAPGVPIYGSLMGNANLPLYKAIFDRVEVQTFGSDAELAMYLKLDAIPCLDLRKPLTVDQLKTKAAIILRNPPRDFFFYADLNSDYIDMPDSEDVVIRDLLVKLKAVG